jgi:ABC-type polysaccharide/polyol phosphate export permease
VSKGSTLTDLDSATSVNGAAAGGLVIVDPASIPSGPPPESFYHHRVAVLPAIRAAWKRREIAFALAERDVRSGYKQQVLGMGWAVINPILSVLIFTIIFSHVKSFKVPGVPYVIYSYTGMVCWVYFAGAFSNGGGAMTGNINLLQKTNFPREIFPLAQMLEQVLYTTISLIPLAILLLVHHFVPHVQALWIPVFLPIELLFTAGLVLAMASAIVYVRDLTQVMGLILQFGLFATPIIWPLSELKHLTFGPFHHADMQPYYVVFNPLGAVMDSVRRTALQGLSPDWHLLGLAAVSACVYFFLGYRIFKRLETGFADIS